MKKILSLIAVFVCLFMAFSLSGCKQEEANPFSGWKITKKQTSEDEALQNYALIRISSTNGTRKVRSIWVNVFGLEAEEATITVAFTNSQNPSAPSEKDYVIKKTDLDANNGWVKLVTYEESQNISYSYVEFVVTENMYLNEIGLMSDKNQPLTLSLEKAGVRPSRGSNSKQEYTKAELEKKIKDGEIKTSALNLIDEQDKFKEVI